MGQRLTKKDIRLLQEDRRINAINFINNIVKGKDELQQRIDKAKEYIEKFDFNYLDETYEHNLREHLENILEILGDKENE